MGRKKSRTPPSAPPKRRREEPFHSPFRDMQEQLRAIGHTPEPATPPPEPAMPPRPARAPDVQIQREKALFLAEMAGVTLLPKDARGRVDKPDPSAPRLLSSTDDLEALADLRDLVEGRGAFTIQYTDEYMEGIARLNRAWRNAYTVAITPCRRILTCMGIRSKRPKSP